MVALLRGGRRPWVEYAEMVEEQGSAVAVLEREQTTQADGQTTLILDDPDPDPDPDPATSQHHIAQAIADLERWDAQGMRLLTILDPGYPPNLKAVHDRPPIVFVAGHITPQDAYSVAVVGARKATGRGTNQAKQIAEHLVQAGYTVASGLAAGIDTAAHTAAFSANGRTIAVIGTGLARSYPPQNEPLQRRIADQCAVISQFWPDAPPTKRSFPMRNAVMSGIALATVVIEASETSGARTQARLAQAHGRPVFLTRALVERQPWAQVIAQRPGTHIVEHPAEITTALERLIAPGTLVA
jgi:DNA processing protein